VTIDFLWTLEPWVLAAYATCMILLFVYACGQLHLMWRSRKATSPVDESAAAAEAPPPPDDPPFVTIQLPVYNEQYVVERLIETIGRMDYPKDRFEIQLLDDSDDPTTTLADHALRRLTERGISVSHVRREDRSGFKAGALAYGMRTAKGEFIAIFDADFLPQPDFLKRTIGWFTDPGVAVVQTRWGHLNERTSWMTRLQAFFLNLHFGFEQPRRARAGLFLNFNGTCGVWRARAIEDAGGWKARTITEDIDLSYRAQMRGWRIVYRNEYETPGELPEEMSGFRTQQYRWMKGGAQNAVLHLRSLMRSGLSRHVRWHGAHHLLSGSVYLLILSALLLSTPLAWLKNRHIVFDYVDFGIPFLFSTGALFCVFHAAQRPKPEGIRANLRFAGMMVLFLMFTMGLSVHNGGAVISGWMGRESPFVRTPKYGSARWTLSTYVKRRLDPKLFRDLLMLGWLGFGLAIGWQRGQFALYPIQLMAAAGLVWVTALSLIHPLRATIRSGFGDGSRAPKAAVRG